MKLSKKQLREAFDLYVDMKSRDIPFLMTSRTAAGLCWEYGVDHKDIEYNRRDVDEMHRRVEVAAFIVANHGGLR